MAEIKWKTQDGREIAVTDMSIEHMQSTIRMLNSRITRTLSSRTVKMPYSVSHTIQLQEWIDIFTNELKSRAEHGRN